MKNIKFISRTNLYLIFSSLSFTLFLEPIVAQPDANDVWEYNATLEDNDIYEICFSAAGCTNSYMEGGTTTAPTKELKDAVKGWMGKLLNKKPHIKIDEMSIPGTHDSGAKYASAVGPSTETQNWSIKEQLDGGIRYFDIRLRPKTIVRDNDIFGRPDTTIEMLQFYHGAIPICTGEIDNPVNCDPLTFQKTMSWMTEFLSQNITESIILYVRHENDDPSEDDVSKFAERLRDVILDYQRDIWNFAPDSIGSIRQTDIIPELADLQKKIWIHYVEPNNDPTIWKTVPLFQNNNNEVSENGSTYNDPVSERTEAALQHMDNADNLIMNGKWVKNAVTGIYNLSTDLVPNPALFALHINEDVFHKLDSYGSNRPVGTIVMDFPGEGLIYRIIKTNFFFKRRFDHYVQIDCYNDVENEQTADEITVDFFYGSEKLDYNTKVPECGSIIDADYYNKTGVYDPDYPLTHIEIRATGNDAFLLDELFLYEVKYDIFGTDDLAVDKIIQQWGVEGGGGFCLSTDVTDRFPGEDCFKCLQFNVKTGAITSCEGASELDNMISKYIGNGVPPAYQFYPEKAPDTKSKDITIYLDEFGIATISPEDLDDGTTSSGDFSLEFYINKETDMYLFREYSFDCSDLGEQELILYASNGYMSNDKSTVTVRSRPVVKLKDITVYLDQSGEVVVLPQELDAGTSACSGIKEMTFWKRGDFPFYTVTKPKDFTFKCAQIGSPIKVFVVAEDSSGNSSFTNHFVNFPEAAFITVKDNLPPIVQTKNVTIYLDALGSANISPQDVDNGTKDNCGSFTLSVHPETFDCADLGTNMVTLTATDASGNSQTSMAMVTVEDNISPTAICQPVTVMLDALGKASITPPLVDNRSADNCGPPVLSLDITSFNCSDIGDNMVKLTAIDASGNSDTCMAIVTVLNFEVGSSPSVMGLTPVCPGIKDALYSATKAYGVTSYNWTYSGTGASIKNNGQSDIMIDFAPNTTAGRLTATYQTVCGETDNSGILAVVKASDLGCSLSQNCPNNLLVLDLMIESPGLIKIFNAEINVLSAGKVGIGETVQFKGGQEVNLLPNFEVELGAVFKAQIETCVDGGQNE